MRLSTLVRDSGDPWLWIYIFENLNKGVPPQSPYYPFFQKTRLELQKQLLQQIWDPIGAKSHRPGTAPFRITPARPTAVMGQYKERLKEESRYQLFLQKQLGQFVQDQVKQAEVLHDLYRGLLKEEQQEVADKLRDPQPLRRWLAIQVISKQRLPLERDLIELLGDPHPEVRQAARQGLVRLSRGNDFGPAPNAPPALILQAQSQWRHWLDLQLTAEEAVE